MYPECEPNHDIARRIKASVRRRILTISVIMGVVNIAAVFIAWRSLAADARSSLRKETERLSALYAARETAALSDAATAVAQRTKALQQEHGELQRALGGAESEMNRLNTALAEKVLTSERIAMAMEEQQGR